MPKKIAIITTHPIQYYAPIFKLLAKEIDVKVFYTGGIELLKKYDRGFNKHVDWDIPLLDGYEFEFLENISKDKGSHHFSGIINSNAIAKIKDYHPDGILVYGWSNFSHLNIIRHFKGKIPLYFRGDSTLLNEKPGLKNLLKSFFLKWVYQHIDVAFYVGTANKAYFKKYGLKENKLILAPHAIDNKRFGEIRTEEAQIVRANFAIKDDEILILYAGKFDTVKNPLLLLDAFINISKRDVHLLFVGNGNLEEKLKAKVSLLDAKNVHFMNFQNQSQMPIIYQACDLFCLPSKSETWGLAINEAMAAGKAVLVSDKVGCSTNLVDTDNGGIFKSDNLLDLTQKLIALTANKYALLELGKNSYQKIQNWSFENQVSAITNYVNR